jgi:multiple sugar transport system substrate-binding protein
VAARGRHLPASRALLAGLALLVATLLAGCDSVVAVSTPATASSLSGIGDITFATGRVDTGYLTSLISQWNAVHPRQLVTLIQLPEDANDQLDQLVTNLQARSDVYDVMNLDVIWTAQFASSGWIVPINPRLFPLNGFLKPAVATATYAGQLYAVPFTSNAGLLYYRKDILAKAGVAPPKTWAQLAADARTIAPRYHLGGYGSQFANYEGLTVNFAEAVQSAGGRILSANGTRVTVNSPQARAALSFLASGFREGWIPKASLGWDEEDSRYAFERGKLLFLRNWPYVYGDATIPGPIVGYPSSPAPDNEVAGKFGVTYLPGEDGPGSSTLGGANLAISAFSRHQRTALAFIKFLTSLSSERQVLVDASQPPVWTRLYENPALIKRFPYLPVLKKAILTAQPRPEIASYNQLSLAISSAVHQALMQRESVDATLTGLSRELNQIIGNR